MDAAWLRIGIDVGSATAVAVACRSDGFWQPLSFDGVPALPAVVARCGDGVMLAGADAVAAVMTGSVEPDASVWDPMGSISVHAVPMGSGPPVSGVELVATLVRRLLDEAVRVCGGPPREVVVVVPAGWGPPRRALLRRAVQHAGVAEPVLVGAAAAIAGSEVVEVPAGRWLAIADIGAHATVSVVRRVGSEFDLLAELDADAAGRRIDHALAGHVAHLADLGAGAIAAPIQAAAIPAASPGAAAVDSRGAVLEPAGFTRPASVGNPSAATAPSTVVGPERDATRLAALRTAKENAAAAPAVLLAGVDGGPAVVLTAADVAAAAGPVLDTAIALVRQAIAVAEVPATTGAGLVLVGGTANLPGVRDRFAAGTGLATVVAARPELATVRAAANAGVYEASAGPLGGRLPTLQTVLPADLHARLQAGLSSVVPPRLSVWQLGLAPLVAVVLSMMLAGQAIFTGQVFNELSTAEYVLFNFGELAMAAVYAVIACASLGLANLNTDRDPAAGPTGAGPKAAALLLVVAGVGVATAGLYAVAAAATLGQPPEQFLRWSLAAALPVAALVAICGLRLGRTTRLDWQRSLLMPTLPLLFGAVGMLAVQSVMHTGPTTAQVPAHFLMLRIGGLLIGIAAGWIVADRIGTRIAAAVPLGVLTSMIAGNTTGVLAAIITLAIVFWWIRRTWQLAPLGASTRTDRAGRR